MKWHNIVDSVVQTLKLKHYLGYYQDLAQNGCAVQQKQQAPPIIFNTANCSYPEPANSSPILPTALEWALLGFFTLIILLLLANLRFLVLNHDNRKNTVANPQVETVLAEQCNTEILEKLNTTMTELIRNKLDQVTALEDMIDSRLRENESLKAEKRGLSDSVDSLKSEVAQLSQAHDDLKAEIHELAGTRNALQGEIAQLSQARDDLRTTNNTLETTISDGQAESGAADERIKVKHDQEVSLQCSIEELGKEMVERREAVVKLEADLKAGSTSKQEFVPEVFAEQVTQLMESINAWGQSRSKQESIRACTNIHRVLRATVAQSTAVEEAAKVLFDLFHDYAKEFLVASEEARRRNSIGVVRRDGTVIRLGSLEGLWWDDRGQLITETDNQNTTEDNSSNHSSESSPITSDD